MSNLSRPPDLYLPIDLKSWNQGLLKQNTNELEIWAMGWYDLIALKNPDGLMNGYAMAGVISRRIPNIVDPWHIPENEYRRLTLALWLATHGNHMKSSIRCDACKETIDFEIDLGSVINEVKQTPTELLQWEEIQVEFKSAVYRDLIEYRNQTYAMIKIANQLNQNQNMAVDVQMLHQQLHNYQLSNQRLKANRIKKINAGDLSVANTSDVLQILQNLDKPLAQAIDQKLNGTKDNIVRKIKCSECSHVNSVSLNMDPAEQFFQQLVRSDDSAIAELFNDLEKETQQIRQEASRLAWYLRGGVNISDIMHMSPDERSALYHVINDNAEMSKKAKQLII